MQTATAPFVHLFVAKGSISLKGSGALDQGDASRITASEGQRISAGARVAEVLMWEMNTSIKPVTPHQKHTRREILKGVRMNSDNALQAAREEVAVRYFRLVDSADPAILDLFTDDAQMFFPKFGIDIGKDQIAAFAQGFAGKISSIQHDIPGLNVISSGNCVVTEGSVQGTTASGVAFPDGTSSFGLFCNVFEFEGERIKRLHIYEDPDFASTHTDGIDWGTSVRTGM
ncbi:nuclear transport factor 2 family protein [Streptomyces mirabilis]|uniref:nuclear transport factor 2 family protein n=1 Tax=Streptomyces mirabilis TaxID=68239 RepID=UPI0036DEA7D1